MSYIDKYKERTPQETIKILTNFFEKRGLRIEITKEVSEIETFSCHIKLFYKKYLIGHSNGKGMSEDFSLASGLSELYERFCNYAIGPKEPNFLAMQKELSLKDKGYIYDKNEKDSNFVDSFETLGLSDSELKKIFSINPKDIKELTEIFGCYDQAVPYHNILTNEEKMISQRALSVFNGTIGLAAGNTFEECFTQGFSEILEKTCIKKLFLENNDIVFVNKESIKNNELKEKLEKIEKLDIVPYVIDLSYTFEYPVVCVIFLDQKNHKSYIEFGASPSFYISLERCLTEMYQGGNTLLETNVRSLQEPFFSRKESVINSCNTTIEKPITNRMFFENIYEKELNFKDFNKDFYLEGMENKDAFEYYKDLIKKQELKVWVADRSLCSEMSALSIYLENNERINEVFYDTPVEEIIKIERNSANNHLKKMAELNKKILNKQISCEELFTELKEKLSVLRRFTYIADWINTFIFSFERNRNYYGLISPHFLSAELFSGESDEDILNLISSDTINFELVTKYLTILRYKSSGNYSFERAKNILKLLGIDFTKEDWNYCQDLRYLAIKTVIEPYYEFLHNEDLKYIIRCFYTDQEFEKTTNKKD